MNDQSRINILLADDDKDDCQFFQEVLDELAISTNLKEVYDGEQLMRYLTEGRGELPTVIFLDLNIPRLNGFECLMEIKKHSVLKTIPVVIYSTSYDEQKSNQLYVNGAHYYICKPADFNELKKVISYALFLVLENSLKPSKEKFLIRGLTPVE